MLRKMPAYIFWEWMAYAELEPFGEERADLRAAQICLFTAAPYRKKGSAAPKLEDYLLKFDGSRSKAKRQSPAAQKAVLHQIPGVSVLSGAEAAAELAHNEAILSWERKMGRKAS